MKTAVVFGATGSIGSALVRALRDSGRFAAVRAVSRDEVDLTQEAGVASLAANLKAEGAEIRLLFIATGALSRHGHAPEKSLRSITPENLADSFTINALGPALVMKHFLPLLPRDGRSVFAALSARVGSIGDNQLGGWYSYRASKAALNQLIHTAAIEVQRRAPGAICVALHPGTVAGALSDGFAKAGLEVQTPQQAASRLLTVLDGLTEAETGGFFDHHGQTIMW